jgi:hypothetical protein
VEEAIEVSFSRDELDVFGKTYKARYLDASFVSRDKVTKSICEEPSSLSASDEIPQRNKNGWLTF